MSETSGDEDYPAPPHDKTELIARTQRERSALEEAIGGLTGAQMTAPGPEGWSPKDHVAHIAVWERVLIGRLQGRSFADAAGMDEETAKATQHMTAETGQNDFFFHRDKDRARSDVEADFRETHRRLLNALQGTGAATLMEHHLVEHVIGDTYEHYREHRRLIQALALAGA